MGAITDKSIFQDLPVAVILKDCSSIRKLEAKLQAAGIKNLSLYLNKNLTELKQTFGAIRTLGANRKALELFGVKGTNQIAVQWQRSFQGKNLKSLVDEFVALVGEDKDYCGVFSYRSPSGRKREVRVRFSVPSGAGKNLSRVMFTLEDVTDQKKTELYLKKLAQLDGLTGLLNRKAIDERVEQELSRAKRYRLDLSCLMIDVDHFKYVNDHFGHQKGDQMIRHVAQIIRENVRRTDIIGRYGGDEFLIILPETKPQNAVIAALRIQKYFMLGMTRYLRRDQVRSALSIGISGFPEKGVETAKDMVALADKIMYKAKISGGDRILHPGMMSQRQEKTA